MNKKAAALVAGLCGLGSVGLGMMVAPCQAARMHLTTAQIQAKKHADYEAKQGLIVSRKHASYEAKQRLIEANKHAGYVKHHKHG